MSFQSEFVNPMRLSRRYLEWAMDSPGDRDRFLKYAIAIESGKRPEIPVMVTNFGKALIGAGKPWLPAATPPPTPPPVVSSSVFAGRGVFSAHNPLSALALQGLVDKIALKADGGDKADPAVVPQLRAAGFRIFVWESEPTEGQAAVDRYGAEAYIPQVEGPGQLEAARRLKPSVRVPQAPVTNVTFTESAWLGEWGTSLNEAYMNVNPGATPVGMEYESSKRGATLSIPVLALYNGASESDGGRLVPLAEYFAHGVRKNFWLYMCEYLRPEDVPFLRSLG